jgi:hypothetical protein
MLVEDLKLKGNSYLIPLQSFLNNPYTKSLCPPNTGPPSKFVEAGMLLPAFGTCTVLISANFSWFYTVPQGKYKITTLN